MGAFVLMRIKIKFGDGEKEIEVSPKKKHRNAFLDKIEELKKVVDSENGEEIKSTREFIDFEDGLAVECSTITQEEYDELDLEEQSKIIKAVRSIVFPHAGSDPALFF